MAEAASPSESATSLLLHQSSLNDPAASSSDAGPALPFLKVNIIVTGCASTVGRAICHELARQGANLALTDISKGGGQDLCMELQKAKYRGSLLFSSFDPKDSERVGAFVRSVSKTLKRLDALVNCAMHSPEDVPMHHIKLQAFEDTQNHNLRAVWAAMQAALARFEGQNDAKLALPLGGYPIVNVTSGYDTNDHFSAYQAARQAIIGATKAAAVEYAYSDVRINSISAGAIEEPDAAVSIVNQIFTSIGSVKAKVPMRRCGKGTEIANAVIFLLSPASSYITGIDLPVDGGISAQRA